MIRHAGLIARRCRGRWLGALIQGASGQGKSDLMLRTLDAGWSMVADDRVLVWASGGRLFGRAPDALAGLMEIRGLGVMPFPALRFCEIGLSAACLPAARIERMPEPETLTIVGVALRHIRVAALEASAPAKLAYALTRVGLPAQASYLACGAGGDHPDAGGVP